MTDWNREIKPWSLMKVTKGPPVPLFEMQIKRMSNPRNKAVIDAIVLKAADTINVVAIDQEGALLVVEQYRFGIDAVLCELPAGVIDSDEEPIVAAKRELREETGYSTAAWTYLGQSFINPAYVDNCCHHFLAIDCRKTHTVCQDELEDIKVHRVKSEEIADFIRRQVIKDAIGKAALQLVFPGDSPLPS